MYCSAFRWLYNFVDESGALVAVHLDNRNLKGPCLVCFSGAYVHFGGVFRYHDRAIEQSFSRWSVTGYSACPGENLTGASTF